MANIPPIKAIDELNIFTRGGTVIDVQKGVKINTTTTTYGGSGYVHPTYGGSVSAPSTTTRHTSEEVMTVFIREAGGSEFSVEFTDSCVPVRAGNRISVVFAGNSSVNRGYTAALVNHDTGQQGVITEVGGWLVNSASGGEGCGLFLLVLILGPITGAFLGMLLDQVWKSGADTFITLCLLSTIAAFYVLFRPYWKRARLAGELKPAIVQRVREEARRVGNA